MNLNALKAYSDRRLIALVLLGISSGLPLVLTMSTLSLWLAETKVDMATIGAFALVGLPYSFKFLWAPLFDHVHVPFLTHTFGQRRSWILVTQICLALAIYALGQIDPRTDLLAMSMLAVAVAFFSASQDVVVDAFRIEILDAKTSGFGAGVFVFGYRIGMIISSAGALYLAEYLAWNVVYAIMAACIGIGFVTTLLCSEPVKRVEALDHKSLSFPERLYNITAGPFVDFTKRHPKWLLILFFIVFYKLGDAFLGHMLPPFYLQLGFTKSEIASVTKVFGLIATILGGFAGGFVVYRLGILRGLFFAGFFQIFANLAFIVLALKGHSVPYLMGAIAVENFMMGMTGSVFVAYLSSLCSLEFTATQYALLSALASTGRTFFSSGAGVLAKVTSWPVFFLVSASIAIPALFALLWLMRSSPNSETKLNTVESPS